MVFSTMLKGVAILFRFTLLDKWGSSNAPQCLVQCAEDIFFCDGLNVDCVCSLVGAGCSGVIIECVESLCPSSTDTSRALTWIGSTCGEDHTAELDSITHEVYPRSIKDVSTNGNNTTGGLSGGAIGGIVGGVLGGLILILVAIVSFLIIHRRDVNREVGNVAREGVQEGIVTGSSMAEVGGRLHPSRLREDNVELGHRLDSDDDNLRDGGRVRLDQ